MQLNVDTYQSTKTENDNVPYKYYQAKKNASKRHTYWNKQGCIYVNNKIFFF